MEEAKSDWSGHVIYLNHGVKYLFGACQNVRRICVVVDPKNDTLHALG